MASKTVATVDVCRIAVPLKVGTATAAEVAGVCLTGILGSTNVGVFRVSISVSTVFSQQAMMLKWWNWYLARYERRRKRASLRVGVECIRNAD